MLQSPLDVLLLHFTDPCGRMIHLMQTFILNLLRKSKTYEIYGPTRRIQATPEDAPDPQRVCRAWHRTSEVKVLVPGVRGA